MPNCELTRGRALNCKDSVSGIESVYMTTSDLGALTIGSEDEVTEIGGSSITVFEYALKGANGLETQINSSTESGTTFLESTLTLQLPKATKEDLKEIKMIVHSRPKVFVKLRSGDLLLVGEKYGVETSGSISSGQGLGDFSGINLTLVSQEANAPRYVVLSGATDADPFAGDVDITTTVGTNS